MGYFRCFLCKYKVKAKDRSALTALQRRINRTLIFLEAFFVVITSTFKSESNQKASTSMK